MAGVFVNPPGFPCTPPGVDILEGGKLTSNNVAGSSHDPLQSPAVASGAVSKPGGDTAGQDALHSAGVEGSEDSGARSKLPQPSQEEETLMCLLQHCICVSRPCEILGDVNAEKAVYLLHINLENYTDSDLTLHFCDGLFYISELKCVKKILNNAHRCSKVWGR